ncbi:hypothetical protein LZ30DRAFT_779093 [Colletotrichum cereale]|nr:hypothetical protein LZ30DRAFT_779093 [Colletotrichum cereale]
MDSKSTRTRPQPDHRSKTSLFLNGQGPEIDGVFGGLTVREDGTLKIPDHYKKLQPALQAYLRQDGRFDWGANPTKREWEALFSDLAAAEARAEEPGRGPFDIFGRMMVKIGERSDQIDPWVNLIPDEFGLCVVKSAFALLLDTAKAYSEKRQAIFDAFLAVRDIIAEASSKGIHFQTEPSVYRTAGDLYESIVDAIQELLLLVKVRKHIKWSLRSKKDSQARDPQTILKGVTDAAKTLSLEVENCRDATIKDTGKDVKQTLKETHFIGWKAAEIKHAVSKVHVDQEEQLLMLRQVQRTQRILLVLAQSRDEANLRLLDSFREQQKKDQMSITKLEWIFRQQKTGESCAPEPPVRWEASRAVISLDRLVKVLCAPSPDHTPARNAPVDLDVLLSRQHQLQLVVTKAASFDPRSESQAHSILNQDRFFDWLQRDHPDLLLVDGGMPGAVQDGISPMSLLCANLGLTLRKLEPDGVFAHFYCGFHANPHRDNWYGPCGMLRSLAAQVLLALVERESLDLGFLDRRSYVRGLENHDLETLGDLLGDLVRQFDAETTIYCIVDGLSKFDVDFRGTFSELEVVMRLLQDIVKDDELRPKLKVLMTVPFRSSTRLRQTVDAEFYLALPPQISGPRGLSEGSIRSSISRPFTRLSASTRPSLLRDTPDWGEDDYDDE